MRRFSPNPLLALLDNTGVTTRPGKAKGHRNAMPFFIGPSGLGFGDKEVVLRLAGGDGFSHPLGSYATTGPGLAIGVAVLGFDLDTSEFGRAFGCRLVCSGLATLAAGLGFVLGCLEISDGDAEGFHLGLDIRDGGGEFLGLDLSGFLLELGDLGLEGEEGGHVQRLCN